MQRFMVTIEGPGWQDLQDVELPHAPTEGGTVETRYGTCLVTRVEEATDADRYNAKIFCRLP